MKRKTKINGTSTKAKTRFKQILPLLLVVVIVVGGLRMALTRSAFDVKARTKTNIEAGTFQMLVTPFEINDAISDPAGFKFNASSFAAAASDITEKESYDTQEKDGETEHVALSDILTAPGYTHAYGFKVENKGNLDKMNVSVEIQATYNGSSITTGTNVANYGKDPSAKITYKVYQRDFGADTWTEVTKTVGTGHLSDVTAMSKVTNNYMVLDTNKTATADTTKTDTGYYVVLLNFESDPNDPTNNYSGDNQYQGAKIELQTKIRAQQPVQEATVAP